MTTLAEIFNHIDDVKQKLSEQEYITISNLLKKCYEEQNVNSTMSYIANSICKMNIIELENVQNIIKTRQKIIERSARLGFSLGQKVKIISSLSDAPERIGFVYRLHKDSLDVLLPHSMLRKITPEEIQAM